MDLDVEYAKVVLASASSWLTQQLELAAAQRHRAARMHARCVKDRKANRLRMATVDRAPGHLPGDVSDPERL